MTSFFSEWVDVTELFSSTVNPLERTQRLLMELQKRSLAEQVMILSWNAEQNHVQILSLWPSDSKVLIDNKLQERLIQKVHDVKGPIVWEDAWVDESIRNELTKSQCESFLVHPIIQNGSSMDILFLMNYASWAASTSFKEYVSFVCSVIALSIQNLRLFNVLREKDRRLKNWAEHVDDRIQEGTKKILEKDLQFYTLFENAKDAIIVHESSGHILEVNHAATALLGYSKKQLIGSNWNRIGVLDHLSDQIGFFQKVLSREPVKPLDTTLRKQDGAVFRAEISSTHVRFQGRRAIQSTVRDLSIHHMLEESYRETKEKYRFFIESAMVGVYIMKEDTIQFMNSMLEKITGYSREELFTMCFYDLIAPEDKKSVMEKHRRVSQGEDESDPYEVRFLNKQGGQTWCEVRDSRVILDGSSAIMGNVIDISARKELQRQLLESQKLESIRTLAGGIAHDFNNLLGGILGYASLLLSDMKQNHPFHDDIHAIAETTKRAAELTNRLLAFARGGKYHVAPIDLNGLLDEVSERVQEMSDRPIRFLKHTEKHLWSVLGDSRQIQQSILNVCINAYDAMPQGGRLTLHSQNVTLKACSKELPATVAPGDYVRIHIIDTGIGMDDAVKSRIFDPFFTTKPLGEGTGMGLAMVYGIVQNHGGFVDVASSPGKGTEVRIYLPRFIEKASAEPEKPRVQEPHDRERTILFVDDEEIIRQVAKRMLERGRHRVLLARNGKEALEIYTKHKDDIDLVLLDFIMPVMGGRETYRRLKLIDEDVRVAFTSGYSLYDRPEYIPLGKAFFIQKPFQTEVLLQKIQEIL
jgi:PAS domain S-box-containing protein